MDNDAVVIEVETINCLKSRLQNLSAELEGPSICKIPDDIKKIHPKAFKPQWVSFGPYHYGEVHLSQMEKEKLIAFTNFQIRCSLSIEDIVKRVSSMLEDLQRSYDKLDEKWKKERAKFLELMILDGCFMLEVLLEFQLEDKNLQKFTSPDVLRDMLLLENQLPMKFLDLLYSMTNSNQHENKEHNVRLLVWQYDRIPPDVRTQLLGEEYLHLLDMYRAELISTESGWKRLQHSLVGQGHDIQLATRFHKAGIIFKKGPTDNLEHVSFDPKKGVLSLPLIQMNGHIESALLNAMAFEKLRGPDNKVASFIVLMGRLIDKVAIESFHQLAKGEVLDMVSQRHYNAVYNSVNEHCNRPWNIWWTHLKDTKFQNPWTIISLLAAFLGFTLAILQTFYGLYAYYYPRPS